MTTYQMHADMNRASGADEEERETRMAADIQSKDAEIARLKADLERLTKESDSLRSELDRLKPSGQVAEDMEHIRFATASMSDGHPRKTAACGALSRLATQAQAAQVIAEVLEMLKANHVPLLSDEREAVESALSLVRKP